MAKQVEIEWSLVAHESFNKILQYLAKEWTEREVENFVERVNSKLEVLARFPYSGTIVENRKNTYHTVLHKKVKLVYNYKPLKREIILLFFWNTQQNPRRFKI